MTLDIQATLDRIDSELADQNARLAEVTEGLRRLPDDLELCLDEQWKDDFERATATRPGPRPIPTLNCVRV